VWNQKGLFTGWHDVDLSRRGEQEAKKAGRVLKQGGYNFDYAFSSPLKRVQETLTLVLATMRIKTIPIKINRALNERRYGDLEGKNKQALIRQYGNQQVFLWRRSFSTRPPGGESLRDVEKRVVPYWQKFIIPVLKKEKRILVVASGNSLRALVKYLDKIPAKQVAELNIPTGIPLVYEFNKQLKPIKHYYLASQAELKAAVSKIVNQAKVK
jgi:2,3-bisphosphoglycerate-dependent phosphoglycerate mutase